MPSKYSYLAKLTEERLLEKAVFHFSRMTRGIAVHHNRTECEKCLDELDRRPSELPNNVNKKAKGGTRSTGRGKRGPANQ